MDTSKRQSRNAAAKIQTLNLFNKHIAEELEISMEQAINLIGTILGNIVRRIGPEEAAQFLSQLPERWRELCLDEPAGPDRQIDAESLVESVGVLLDLDYEESEEVVRAFWAALSASVSEEALDQVVGQLPKDMQMLILGDRFNEFEREHGAHRMNQELETPFAPV
jgi:uncharacterized protein (DUF2267 family)